MKSEIDKSDVVKVPYCLAINMLEYVYDLIGMIGWWKDEPRLSYKEDYAKMVADAESLSEIISNEEIITDGDDPTESVIRCPSCKKEFEESFHSEWMQECIDSPAHIVCDCGSSFWIKAIPKKVMWKVTKEPK